MVPSCGLLVLCRSHGGFVPLLSSLLCRSRSCLGSFSLCAKGDESLKRRCLLGLGSSWRWGYLEGYERGL